ncbi:Galactan beta-1,4-galactosyltransferase GALS3 [Vitis vinifera]|uniref:Galactan beta-1,4-galactosyltransferase GALS3 n=1 Tax=Vitis vinifera TaxID=29760 RepID=A0A438C5Y2_VITVI|nr:Galactan beta-1,4-galactosyltransferase GALS3 [Vitis vinifera]
MANEKERVEKKTFVGFVRNCMAELKILLTALLLLCTIATLVQFLPPRFSFSPSDLRNCLSAISSSSSSSNSSQKQQKDQILDGGIIKRAFNPYGAAAYNFVLMSAYRGGLNTFAVVGLASKPLHLFVGQNGSGGQLLLHACSTSGGGDRDLNVTDTIEALIEAPGSLNASFYTSPAEPKYDYLYCGSSLYGNLSPQRVREWIAYHVKFFGERSHFVIHDAGGVHSGVLEVLKPWMEKGYRFMAKWMFFFDVDEYIYVPPKNTIKSVLNSLSGYTQFTIEQMPISNKLCLSSDAGKAPSNGPVGCYNITVLDESAT